MSIDLNDEIVQDYIIEAGEILDRLGNELVDLETRPQDADLLNSVFRGFHTIKGGAGFLALENLVAISHKAEDVFDLCRSGERQVTPALMDRFLSVIDELNRMFEELKEGEEPTAAEPALLDALARFASGEPDVDTPTTGSTPPPQAEPPADAPAVEPEAPATAAASEAVGEDISEDEFDALLNELHGEGRGPTSSPAAPVAAAGDDITEEEFQALLDQLHGSGAPGAKAEEPEKAADAPAEGSGRDLITEGEFDALLDQLHGSGGAPTPARKTAAPEDAAAEPVEQVTEAKAVPVAAPEEPKKPEPKKPEDEKAVAAKKASGGDTVRVETQILDDIMNLVGELVLIRNRLSTLESSAGDEEISRTVGSLDIITNDLQNVAMKTRMQPVKKIFGRFPRVVRDLARSLGKEITLEVSGEETDLDKNLVEALADPLVHLVRNAVDHGVEMPDAREAAGKPRMGTIRLAAEQEGDRIKLEIQDDGAGMDPEVLRRKAVEKGVMDEDAAARLTDQECFALIFSAGFSTKQEVSDISGRGVGMDVVKTRINQLNGTVEINSEREVGTTLTIHVPLTLAIVPTLMIELGDQIFALPLVNVHEIIEGKTGRTNVVDGQPVMVVRERTVPLYRPSQWLVNGLPQESDSGQIVIVNVGAQQVGLVVDQLLGREEVVIKPLGSMLQNVRGLAGATVTGDGRIALILDLPSLLAFYASRRM